jgi:hypothetical protein
MVVVACMKLVRKMGWRNGEKVVTVLCMFSYPLTPENVFSDTRVKLI